MYNYINKYKEEDLLGRDSFYRRKLRIYLKKVYNN